VKTFSNKSLGRGPETLTAADVRTMAEALTPMLKTLVGRQRSETVIQQILQEFGWIEKGVGRGIDTAGTGYSQI